MYIPLDPAGTEPVTVFPDNCRDLPFILRLGAQACPGALSYHRGFSEPPLCRLKHTRLDHLLFHNPFLLLLQLRFRNHTLIQKRL